MIKECPSDLTWTQVTLSSFQRQTDWVVPEVAETLHFWHTPKWCLHCGSRDYKHRLWRQTWVQAAGFPFPSCVAQGSSHSSFFVISNPPLPVPTSGKHPFPYTNHVVWMGTARFFCPCPSSIRWIIMVPKMGQTGQWEPSQGWLDWGAGVSARLCWWRGRARLGSLPSLGTPSCFPVLLVLYKTSKILSFCLCQFEFGFLSIQEKKKKKALNNTWGQVTYSVL